MSSSSWSCSANKSECITCFRVSVVCVSVSVSVSVSANVVELLELFGEQE